MTAAVLEVGSRVRFEGRSWTVVMIEGARARLVDSDNSTVTVLVSYLFAAPDFELVGAPRRQVPPFGLLEELPQHARERAQAWERHVREVETGFPVPGQGGVPRAEFDPVQRTSAEREEAKAAELTAAGQSPFWGRIGFHEARRRSRHPSGQTTHGRTVESPVLGDGYAGFGERPGETGRWQHRYRAPGRLNRFCRSSSSCPCTPSRLDGVD